MQATYLKWIIKKPKVIFELNELNELPKTKTHPFTYQEKFHNILNTIATTYMSLQMAPRTMTQQLA